jgi:two-component system, cell cycle response regulator CpdR
MSARILVAEDDPSVRSFVLRALTLRGHDVTTVSDGLQALEVLGADAFDLLITDIVMPGLDGIALALRVGRDYPDLPILMMTGYSAERQKAHNLEQLIARVILKPFTLQQICNAVDETLGQPAVSASTAAEPPAP